MRWLFTLRLRRTHTYLERDRVLELYAPLSLLSLPPVWLMLVLAGYMGIYWALGISSWYEAFRDSGSALLTLGFAPVDGVLTDLTDVLRGHPRADLPGGPPHRLSANHVRGLLRAARRSSPS